MLSIISKPKVGITYPRCTLNKIVKCPWKFGSISGLPLIIRPVTYILTLVLTFVSCKLIFIKKKPVESALHTSICIVGKRWNYGSFLEQLLSYCNRFLTYSKSNANILIITLLTIFKLQSAKFNKHVLVRYIFLHLILYCA